MKLNNRAGLNVDPRRPGVDICSHAVALGVGWVRFVLLTDDDQSALIAALHALGVRVLGVLARETLGDDEDGWPAALEAVSGRYPGLDAVEVGNEEDQHSGSSWWLDAAKLNRLLAAVHQYWSPLPPMVILGGLVSGNVGYLDGVNLGLVTAVAIHPYGQRPDHRPIGPTGWGFGVVGDLLDAYQAEIVKITGATMSLVMSEYGAPFPDLLSDWLRYIAEETAALLDRDDVMVACWFCLHDYLGFGLLSGFAPNGGYDVFRDAVAAAMGEDEGESMDSLEAVCLRLNGPAVNPKAHPTGIWQDPSMGPHGIVTTPASPGVVREAWLDTPEWRLVREVGGHAVELQVSQPPKA